MSESIYKIMKENKFEIVSEISRELKCNICNELMIKACSAPCGCCFCSDCIEQYLDGADKFCPGTSRRCQMKIITYANDIVIDIRANVKISEIIVKCPRQNCEFEDELEMIANHMRTCDKRPISCPFNAIGCKVNEVMNDEMKVHLNEDNYNHSKLLIDLINNLLSEMESMKNEIIEVKRENSQFKQKIDNIELQSANQQQKIGEMENPGEIDELNEEMVVLKNENRRLRSEMEKNAQSINAMRQQIGMIETKSGVDNNEMETFKMIIDGKIDDLELKMIELEVKVENKKSFWHHQWLIENFSKQKKGKWIFSDSFYAKPSGYKMCLSAIMDSNDILYVYFHLVRGESDDKLAWPFKYAVTIDVIHTGNRDICSSKTIKHSECQLHAGWKKPSNDRSDAIYFLRIRVSTDSLAARNDQLLIKCRVESE